MSVNFFKLLIFAVFIFFFGCSPKVRTMVVNSEDTKNNKVDEIVVLKLADLVPDSCKMLGHVRVFDSGFTNDCDFDKVIEVAKNEAKKIGGNVLKITEHKTPSLSSTCHQIKADIYYRKNISTNFKKLNLYQDSITRSKFNNIEKPDYAILYIYRPRNYNGSAIRYKLHMDDKLIGKIRNDSKYEVKLYKKGKTEFWAKTEAKESVNLNVEFGEEYFLKCEIDIGIAIGRPVLNFIDKKQGREEFEKVSKNDTKDDIY